MVYMKAVQRVNPKSSHHKKKDFFYFFYFISIGDDGCSLKLLSSFHDVYKSNHYTVHLKLIQCCMSIISR